MLLDELKAQWEKDCIIDELNLGAAAASTPMLHSKYINELIAVKMKQTKLQMDSAKLRALKSKYFRGELTSQELAERGWEQWHYKTLRSDIEGLLEADSELQVLIAREQYLKIIVYFLESVLGEIKSRSFSIRATLDWQKFRAGN
jgi:hypothetical protein